MSLSVETLAASIDICVRGRIGYFKRVLVCVRVGYFTRVSSECTKATFIVAGMPYVDGATETLQKDFRLQATWFITKCIPCDYL